MLLFSWTLFPFFIALLDATQMEKLVYDYNCFAAQQIIDDIKYLR